MTTTPDPSAVHRVRADRLSWSETDGEIVVLDLAESMYVLINGSGAKLWHALVDGSTPERLTELLVEAYRIPPDAARADTGAFVAELDARGWLETGR